MNSLLKALVDAPSSPGISGASPIADGPAKPPVQKMNYSHVGMAKVIAANPAISQNELADIFGYSPSWISRILCTDAFQVILAEEMKDMPFTAEMRTNTRLKIQSLLDRSIEILCKKLDRPIEEIPDQLAVQSAKMAATALESKSPVLIHADEVNLHLDELGKNLVGLLHRKKQEVVDAEVVPTPGA